MDDILVLGQRWGRTSWPKSMWRKAGQDIHTRKGRAWAVLTSFKIHTSKPHPQGSTSFSHTLPTYSYHSVNPFKWINVLIRVGSHNPILSPLKFLALSPTWAFGGHPIYKPSWSLKCSLTISRKNLHRRKGRQWKWKKKAYSETTFDDDYCFRCL